MCVRLSVLRSRYHFIFVGKGDICRARWHVDSRLFFDSPFKGIVVESALCFVNRALIGPLDVCVQSGRLFNLASDQFELSPYRCITVPTSGLNEYGEFGFLLTVNCSIIHMLVFYFELIPARFHLHEYSFFQLRKQSSR